MVDLLNITAYRVYKILYWLQETPLSVEELNVRFVQDARTRKKLSTDSIGLYINTLKMLGCEISRPSKKNQYRYELVYHPFGIPLTEKDLEALVKIKSLAEERLSYQEVLVLHRLIKDILQQSSVPNRERWFQELFTKSRSVDYEPQLPLINELQVFATRQQLLSITYESPVNGKEQFYFLPDTWIYRQGVFYLSGNQPGREEATLLRLDRILQYEPHQDKDMLQSLLLHKLGIEPKVVISFYGITDSDFEPLEMDEALTYHHDANPPHLTVTFRTRDFFILKQKLLSYGVPFEVQEPDAFKREMIETLQTMQKMYAAEVLS